MKDFMFSKWWVISTMTYIIAHPEAMFLCYVCSFLPPWINVWLHQEYTEKENSVSPYEDCKELYVVLWPARITGHTS